MGAMTPEALFTAALQLEAGWKVVECRFEGEPKRLVLKLDFESGKKFGCPQCGRCARRMTRAPNNGGI